MNRLKEQPTSDCGSKALNCGKDSATNAANDELSRQIQQFLDEFSTMGASVDPKNKLSTGEKKPPSARKWKPQSLASTRVRRLDSGRILIAILPDPIRTHLALRFDSSIDSCQDALQDLGWTFDHSWLPWDGKMHTDSDRFLDREIDSAEELGWESIPGVLFFRGGDDLQSMGQPTGPLIVLLVSDTPTSGVSPQQFKNAFDIWDGLTQSSQSRTLRILGPSFSGSISSLHHLLVEHLPQDVDSVAIASGTITSSKRLEELKTIRKSVKVESFSPDAIYERDELLAFLARHHNGGHIVELREAESTYGAIQSSDLDQTAFEQRLASQGVPGPIPVIHFPREISTLREAYERNGIIGFSDSSSAPQTQLRLSPGADSHDGDTVASFSGQQDDLDKEAIMADIAGTINVDHDDIVLLGATDVFDEIFITQYLRRHSPGATVILFDSDLLFLRRGDGVALDNTYVVSTWPLIEQNRRWSGARNNVFTPQHHLFGSLGAQGVHAAVLDLMLNPSDQAKPDHKTLIEEYRSPFDDAQDKTRPPTWLSVIEQGRFSPIALLDVDQSCDQIPKQGIFNLPILPVGGPSFGINEPLGLSIKLAAAFIGLLLLYHASALLRCRLDRRFAWVYALADAEHRSPRLWSQAIPALLAIPGLALLKLPSGKDFIVSAKYFTFTVWFLQVLACLCIMLPLFLHFRGPTVPIGRAWHRLWLKMLAAAAVLATMIVLTDSLLYSPVSPMHTNTEHLFFLYRSSLLLSGASPAFSVLLLLSALGVWLHSHFGRLVFFGHRIPQLPPNFKDVGCPSSEDLNSVSNIFRHSSGWNSFHFEGWNLLAFASACVIVVTTLWIGNSFGPRSLAYGSFDKWVRILAAVITILLLQDVFVSIVGWNMLRTKCLIPLKQSPLRWGFTWIKGFSWRRLWTSPSNLSPDVIFDYLARLNQANNRVGTDLRLQTAYQQLRTVYYSSPTGWLATEGWAAEVAKYMNALHVALCSAATAKLNELRQMWHSDVGALTGFDKRRGYHLEHLIDNDLKDIPAGTADRSTALQRMGMEEFVALLYLGYIRMVLIQIRNRLYTSLALFILLLWGLNSYPWMNHHAILIALSGVLLIISVALTHIYSGMHRDDILSRTTETTPGSLGADFYIKIIPTIGIPLLTLVATQFPELSTFIFSWIEPGLRGS